MHRLGPILLGFTLPLFTLATLTWALPLQREVTMKELMPLNAWQKQFKITEGKDRGKVVPLVMHHVQSQDRSNLVFGDYGGIVMIKDSRGGLAMERLDLFKSRSYIIYEPALPVLPPDLTLARSIRHQARFNMYDARTGRLKRSGQATHLVKQVSHSRFATPAGDIDGYYIDLDHVMDMQFATLHITLGLGCRLDDGPVYGSGQYTLTKLGIFTETKTVAAGLTKDLSRPVLQ
jgi:hypothetical protein